MPSAVHFFRMIFSRKNVEVWCERGMLVLLLIMLIFGPLAFGAVDEWSFLILQALGMGIFLLWAGRLWADPKPKLLWPPLTWAVMTFMVYAIVRYFTAEIEYVARVEVIQVFLFGLIFLVIVTHLHGHKEAQIISFTLITLATLISGYAVGQLLTHSSRVWNVYAPYPGRAGGTYILPNDLAGLLGMLLPLTLAYLIVGRLHIVTRILLIYAAGTMLAGLGATFSRAGWVASALGIFFVLVVLLFHRKHRLGALLILLVLLVGGGVYVSRYLSKTEGFQQRVVNHAVNGPSVLDFNTRFELWRAGERMWLDHFWVGAGPAHFDYFFPQYRPVVIQERPNRTHNDYVNLLADWGAVGGVIVLGGMGIFFLGLMLTWPHVRRSEADFSHGQSNRFAFFLGATGGLLALAIHSAADFNLHIPANALVGVTLLALLSSNVRFATGRHWHRAGLPLKMALTGTLAVVVMTLATDEWRRGHETFWLSKAEGEDYFSPTREAFLKKAYAYEPKNFQTAYDIGECCRMQSFQGGDDYVPLGKESIEWYTHAIALNHYDGYSYMRTGMSLDWLGDSTSAEKFYQEAEPLDPNGYFMVANIGWHFVQIGDYAMARQYFIRSITLSNASVFAQNYLQICEEKLLEQASGKPRFPLKY